MTRFHRLAWPLAGLLGSLAAAAVPPALAAQACSVKSAAVAPPVVELYTSEGCNSCPPADKWLSKLKTDPSIVALAFHVDYWDRLGWKDRFASAAYTQRQAQQQSVSGARFSYTPQVVVDGVDRPAWSNAAIGSSAQAAAPVAVNLARDGDRFSATVVPSAAAPAKLAAYWAVTEQGYVSDVKAGENSGVTLHHDFVVREYRTVAPWSTDGQATATLQFEPGAAADPAHAREVDLVVVDAATGRPIQAVKLGC